ncbi:tRNA (guanine(10)-N2)-methyltransferase homolog isoform X2 [Liolophura sinensis]
MDPTLSLIMTNLAEIKENHLVFDPFVGTGSLLVPSAHFGAYVLGTDIDYLIIHGKGRSSRHKQKFRGPDENIRANLRQYNLEKFYLDAMLADASRHDMWRQHELFDAIVTDPPYGIRESARRIGTEKEEVILTEENKDGHIPQRVNYDLSDIFKDLLNFAAKFLRLHGRLVYWLPVYTPEYSSENIPRHPCLELRSNCEQPLSVKVSRRLIAMEKTREYCECAERHGAHVAKDHYQGATFRERYFKPAHKHSHDQHKSVAMETDSGILDSDIAGNIDCRDVEESHCGGKESVHPDRDGVETDGAFSCAELDTVRDSKEPLSEIHHANESVATLDSIGKETVEMDSTEVDTVRTQMDAAILPKRNDESTESVIETHTVSKLKVTSYKS